LKIVWHTAVLDITISIGVAFFPEHGDTLQQALEAADAALYKPHSCIKKMAEGEKLCIYG
jgi:GGDEF domain-containing protein